ncbi:hypothetical protein [Streptomyces sirii]|uniref:hypothetical protein n=1 Tax=Streptomyces sirii TaxID=3127701 RepID=UPI003D36D08C
MARPLEDAVWAEITKILGDQEKLRRLAEEWLGDVPNTVEAYRERIADVDAQIEETRRMRKNKLVALAAVVAADEGDDTAAEADLQAAVAEVKVGLREKDQHLRVMRDDAMERLLGPGSRRTARCDAPPATAGW